MDTAPEVPKITLMDEYVRRGMMTFPSIYPNRLRVLAHTFLVLGNGVEWADDGTLPMRDFGGEMKYDDLDTRLDRFFDKSLLDDDDTGIRARMQEGIDEERRDREARAANIYELASRKVPESFKFVYEDDSEVFKRRLKGQKDEDNAHGGHYEEAKSLIRYIEKNYLTLANMPERVEKSFFEGALEILDVVIRSTEDMDERSTLLDYRDSLVEGHTLYDGGWAVPPEPVVIPATFKKVSFRERGGYVVVIVDRKPLTKFSEYRAAAEFAMAKFGLDETQMGVIYRDYKKDYEKDR